VAVKCEILPQHYTYQPQSHLTTYSSQSNNAQPSHVSSTVRSRRMQSDIKVMHRMQCTSSPTQTQSHSHHPQSFTLTPSSLTSTPTTPINLIHHPHHHNTIPTLNQVINHSSQVTPHINHRGNNLTTKHGHNQSLSPNSSILQPPL